MDGMIDIEKQDKAAINGVSNFLPLFSHSLVKLCIQICDLSEMTSCRTKENEAVLLFSLKFLSP